MARTDNHGQTSRAGTRLLEGRVALITGAVGDRRLSGRGRGHAHETGMYREEAPMGCEGEGRPGDG